MTDTRDADDGCLAFLLHAHLPFLWQTEHEDPLEERWLQDALTESYLPLLLMLDRLEEDGVDFRLNFTLTPPLVSMLQSPALQGRYAKRLEQSIRLAEAEIRRGREAPEVRPLARMYHSRFLQLREAYETRYERDVVGAFARHQRAGRIEILASAATHALLPLLAHDESALRTQVRLGVAHYRSVFGIDPSGFWLPECGYHPDVEPVLLDHGIRYTILETHGVTRAEPRPARGVYEPVRSPAGLTVFGRDPESSRQVWSAAEGYPGDPSYREYYRDLGFDASLDAIRPFIHSTETRIDTGLKYHRIGAPDEPQPFYSEAEALRRVAEHAEDFVTARIRHAAWLRHQMDAGPVIVAPYDAELFGHWWYEGPDWLETVLRRLGNDGGLPTVRLSDRVEAGGAHEGTPAPSTWGEAGNHSVWLNERTDWIYPSLAEGAGRIRDAVADAPGDALSRRAADQAVRELMLAQASDWAFLMHAGTTGDYGVERTRLHLSRLHRICGRVEAGCVNVSELEAMEKSDGILDGFDTSKDFGRPTREATTRVTSGRERPHVVMITAECSPYAKTGGLADMVRSLSDALSASGVRVSVIMPAYRNVLARRDGPKSTDTEILLEHGGEPEVATVLRDRTSGVDTYFVRIDGLFDRDGIYGTETASYEDNPRRFALFCRAALKVASTLPDVDIVHCHDWHAALAVACLNVQPHLYPNLSNVRTVFTIHNLGYQGTFDPADWDALDLPGSFFSVRWFEFYDQVNPLKAGLVFADVVTTVSPTYAREIRTEAYGWGLEGVLQTRANRLTGILNGIDEALWDPGTDVHIAKPYGPDALAGKRACKTDLQKAFGLPRKPKVPVIGMVTRLAAQKGIDLVAEAADRLLERDLQLAILGSGEAGYEQFLTELAERAPDRMAVRIAFSEALAHKVEAGSDCFLMPSRYEPCGLNQMYSLRYGTPPIVHGTGGLKDTVRPFDAELGEGTGFVFDDYTSDALIEAVDRALACYHRPKVWRKAMVNGMRQDFSWGRSATTYRRVYERLLETAPIDSTSPIGLPGLTGAEEDASCLS